MAALPQSPLSLWLAEYGPSTPSPPLAGELSVDVAIVGGGFQGLSTAIALRRTAPALRVAVLEHEVVGYGASGRNGSFAMTIVGLGFGVMARLKGHAFVRDAHRYMERAVDGLEALIREHGLDCDMIRPGFLRMALAPGHVRRLQDEIALVKRLGIEGIDWLDAGAARARVDSPYYLGAMWEPRLVLVNPAKLVREEKRLALALGAQVFEHTPVTAFRRGHAFTLETPQGSVRCEKLVLATNAYSIRVPELRRKQTPAFTYMIATEPLSPLHLRELGWAGREGVEDARNLIHYYRITPDGRLVMGGGPVGLGWHSDIVARRRSVGMAPPRDARANAVPGAPRCAGDASLGRSLLGDARPDARARTSGRYALRVRARLHRTRRRDDAPECADTRLIFSSNDARRTRNARSSTAG